ncbi:methyltransferase domain family protein [Clostridium botulinum A1 str. CFSAN002368]|nr:methyltransferase domain family protein [Clostridium botulinum A1 str. CFSAN002368]
MWIAKLLSFLSKILFGNKGKTHTIILCEKRLKDRENGKKLYVLITVDMEVIFMI